MARRRKRRKPPGEVQMNLAAMLDMAFQLLAFFILTFRPAPVEGHVQLHMPPAVPQTDVNQSTDTNSSTGGETSAFVETLELYIMADNRGQVTAINVGQQTVVAGRLTGDALGKLNANLRSNFGIQESPYERIQLHVDRRLHYDALMKIVDVCTRQTLPDGSQMRQVGFMELGNAAE